MAKHNSAMAGPNRLKLGLAGANCSSGQAITKVPERWNPAWANNVALAKMADDAGLEFSLPIGRWFGFGGKIDFQDQVLETMTWAAGLLAVTRKITLFSTVHTAFFHPVIAAKQIATMDHISSGRYALNVVCGWNAPEYRMFGLSLPESNATRYEYGQEWLDLIRRIWREDEPFDWNGTHFQLQNVHSSPKPFGGSEPLIMNAGASGPGRDFAARNTDCSFVIMGDPEKGGKDVADIKAIAQTHGRDIDIYTACHIVCRPTTQEARDYYAYYAGEQADWDAVDNLIAGLSINSQSLPPEYYTEFRTRFAGGHGSYPIVGDPDHVANELARVSQAGYAGTALSFVNYLDELPYFRDEVLPRLQDKGLREAAT